MNRKPRNLIELKFAATCAACGAPIAVGESARYYGHGKVYGLLCHGRANAELRTLGEVQAMYSEALSRPENFPAGWARIHGDRLSLYSIRAPKADERATLKRRGFCWNADDRCWTWIPPLGAASKAPGIEMDLQEEREPGSDDAPGGSVLTFSYGSTEIHREAVPF